MNFSTLLAQSFDWLDGLSYSSVRIDKGRDHSKENPSLLAGVGKGASFNCFEAANSTSALRLLATSDFVAVPSGIFATRGGCHGRRELGTGALDFIGRIFPLTSSKTSIGSP
jgi:hypothetical protein